MACTQVRFQTQRGIACVPKSKTEDYLRQNLESCRFELSDAQLAELVAMETGFRFGANLRDKAHPRWPFHEEF